jgi:large subunit ribosomal protein L18
MSSRRDQQRSRVRHERRERSVRSRVVGTAERPRLTVFRSSKNIYCQIVDDYVGHTVAAASTLSEGIELPSEGGKCAAAKAVGRLIAEKALAKGVQRVCFDRGGYKFHGRVKALADAAREAGLDF